MGGTIRCLPYLKVPNLAYKYTACEHHQYGNTVRHRLEDPSNNIFVLQIFVETLWTTMVRGKPRSLIIFYFPLRVLVEYNLFICFNKRWGMLEHLLVISWNDIDVIFLLHLCHSRRSPGEYQEILYHFSARDSRESTVVGPCFFLTILSVHVDKGGIKVRWEYIAKHFSIFYAIFTISGIYTFNVTSQKSI
jgi:hypothetical protein